MPKTVNEFKKKKISDYKYAYFVKTGEAVVSLASKLEGNDAEEARKYGEVLKDFFDKKDDEYIKEHLEILDGLKTFLSKKGKDGKTYYDALLPEFMNLPNAGNDIKTDPKKAGQKIDENILFIYDTVGIEGHPDDMKAEAPAVTIGGQKLTRVQFKQKMYENHWDPQKDDKALDAVFDCWKDSKYMQSNLKDQEFINNNAGAIETADKLMKNLLEVPVTPDHPAAYKLNAVDSIKESIGIEKFSDQYYEMNSARGGYQVAKLFEDHEDKKAKFIEDARKMGYTLDEDIELLKDAFDCGVDKTGKPYDSINKQLDKFIKKEGAYENKSNNECLKIFAGEINNTIHNNFAVLTDAQVRFRSGYEKRDETLTFRIEADGYARQALAHGWMGPKEVYYDLFTVYEFVGEDQEIYDLLDEMVNGRSMSYQSVQVKPDGQLIYLQSYESLKKAKELLENVVIDQNAQVYVDKAIKSIEKALPVLEEGAEREREFTVPMLNYLNSFSEENKNDIKALYDEMGKIKSKDLPAGATRLWGALEIMKDDPKNINGIFVTMVPSMKSELENNLAGFVGALGTNHILYEKAVKVLGIFDPDHVEQAKTQAAETTRRKEEAVAADIANAQQQMEERYNAFIDERNKFLDLRTNMQELEHAYFGHGNSTEYTNMMRALDECINAKNDSELDSAKGTLAQRAKDYLDHTGLGKASKLHGKSETRRLCAFYMMSVTDETLYDQYALEANTMRQGEDKISLNRLRNLEGVGKPSAAIAAALNNGPAAQNIGPAVQNNQHGPQNRVGINDLVREENAAHPNQANNAAPRVRPRRTMQVNGPQNNNAQPEGRKTK